MALSRLLSSGFIKILWRGRNRSRSYFFFSVVHGLASYSLKIANWLDDFLRPLMRGSPKKDILIPECLFMSALDTIWVLLKMPIIGITRNKFFIGREYICMGVMEVDEGKMMGRGNVVQNTRLAIQGFLVFTLFLFALF